MRGLFAVLCLGFWGLATAWGQQPNAVNQQCLGLAHLALPHTSVTQAQVVESGQMSSPAADKDPVYSQMPGFCRVVAEASPTSDSSIKIEIWMPLAGWNGRFLGVGNGGFAGNIYYHEMAGAVKHGYAVASTDTGHTGTAVEAAWALGHPEKVADFGYRGVHEMSRTGQWVARAFYGKAADRRYFDGCSDGGREALMEAERFPADYDGILAGAPAYNWTHLVSSGIYVAHALLDTPAGYLPASKLPAISAAVLAQCGKGNSFVDDPRQCRFDAGALLCNGAETAACLTAPQVATLKALYAGAHTKDGKLVDYGPMPGAELGRNGWEEWITGSAPSKALMMAFVSGYFADMVYNKPDLDIRKLDLDEGLKAAVERTGTDLDAVSPDLSAFSAHGGKLILYHGWDDPAIPALGTADYYSSVVAAAGQAGADGFARLYMVPGMQHCDGGPGPTTFGQSGPYDDPSINDPGHNIYLALEAWVEREVAPQKIIAQKMEERGGKPAVIFSRPLCPYPQAAQYNGAGDRDSAASYSCVVRK